MFLVCLKISTLKFPKTCWTDFLLNFLMKKFSCQFDASPSKDRLIESTLPQEISICAFVAFSFQVVFTETFMQNSEWLSYDDTKYFIHQFENVSIETFMHDHLKDQRKLLQTLQADVSNVYLTTSNHCWWQMPKKNYIYLTIRLNKVMVEVGSRLNKKCHKTGQL